MLKNLPFYIKIILFTGTVYAITTVYPEDKNFKSLLIDYINTNSISEQEHRVTASETFNLPTLKQKKKSITYKKGDWEEYIVIPEYQYIDEEGKGSVLYDNNEDVNILSYGSIDINLSYGDSLYTNDKYKQFAEDNPTSRVINPGFRPVQESQFHIEGKVGKRLTVFIDHDSRKEDNTYIMQYKAIREDEVIREINAGNIDIDFNHSKYAVYDNTTSKGMGLDLTLKKNKFQLKAFGSILRGETEVEYFRGNSSPGNYKLSEYQFNKKIYYQLEPFKRYDNISTPPTDSSAYNLITFTSAPSNPQQYFPYPVNVDPSGFELYMDDQNAFNNHNAITLSIDNGNYTKLSSGTDYSINYATGLISFTTNIPDNARIFAVYTVNGGTLTTTDQSARTDIYSGKLFVFLKYGYSIDEDMNKNFILDAGEDKNNDGMLNVDNYEVRSFYFIGDKYILSNNFNIKFLYENGTLTKSEINNLGRYSVNYSEGLIEFSLREPFKSIMSTSASTIIYNENQADDTYEYSRYKMNIDYFRESRSFQLKHSNILPDSVRIRINGNELSKSLYTIDYTSGFLMFTDSNNPLIDSKTEIEIKYEYLPFESQSKAFVGGLRADYKFNKNFNIGGSLLYSRSSDNDIIPDVGSEPEQTVFFEGDASIHLDGKTFAKLSNLTSKKRKDNIPIELNLYGEYARSYKNSNIFGKGLIDNMESTDEIISISMSERDWILASMPQGATQNDRGILNYYYYRNPSSPGQLKGPSYNATAVNYSVKPGPFNVATGHIDNAIEDLNSQRSLAFDFDFSTGDYASVATRKLSDASVDFSGLQYVEIWYKYEGEATNDTLDLYLELGKIDEDSDGDGRLDTEDLNNNGHLDTDPNAGTSEDIGYEFNDPVDSPLTRVGSGPMLNSTTRGNGILNSEDLNENGILDTDENTITIPNANTTPVAPLTLTAEADPTWQKARIYIDQSGLSTSEIDLIKQIETLRLYVTRGGANAGNGGRLYIDNIKFISSKWRKIQVENNPSDPMDGLPTGPDDLTLTMINSINDSEYRANSFLSSKKSLYKSLYGEKKDSELSKEKETSLQLEYSVPGAATSVSTTRYFTKPLDLRYYKTMNLWLHYRTPPTGELGVIIGSSDDDYVEYKFQVSTENIWKEIKLKLSSGSNANISPSLSNGNIDMKRISFIKFLIYAPGDSGTIWLNDIYVSQAENLKDHAHWAEAEFLVKRPFYRKKDGTPVMSDFSIKYIKRGNGAQFDSLGKTSIDIYEDIHEVLTSVKILPNWDTNINYIYEASKTDSLNEQVIDSRRGNTTKNSLYFLSDYASLKNAVPSLKITYKFDNYNNISSEDITGYDVKREKENYSHAPSFNFTEKINNFLMGKLTANILMNMLFKNEDISRNSNEVSQNVLSSLTTLIENEKRQKTDTSFRLDYTNKYFYLKPAYIFGSEEIVSLKGRTDINDTEVLSNVNGNFHFPFIYHTNFKFIERNEKANFAIGLTCFKYLSPSYIIDIHYLENRFRDYDNNEIPDSSFSRKKDARSYVSTQINLPVNIQNIKSVNFIKSLELSYSRSVYLYETSVPFEGEGHEMLNEKFGISRSLNDILGAGLNIFKYYPFNFYIGRNNFANGRDYIYKKLNTNIKFSDESTITDYNNQLKLIDNFALNWTFDFDKLAVDSGGGLNQICERQNIYGIPQQIISWNAMINFNLNLMKLFNFGFFRENKAGQPFHSSNLELGYSYNSNMIITSNLREDIHSPNFGLTFKWDRASIGLDFKVDIRQKQNKTYIKNSSKDNIYINNMPGNNSFQEYDFGYNLTIVYETDVKWIYNLFAKIYTLAGYPIFTLEYTMNLNRYDYTVTVSPIPYDMYLMSGNLTLDLHKNIQGSIYTKFVIEHLRNVANNAISREIFSYELGLNFSLLF